jgi:hypothetical protein
MTNSWAHGVSGSFDTPSDWTAGVPTAGSTALITAAGTYTVTSSQDNSLGVLNMAKKATLAISADDFDVTSGTGTGALDGTITVADAARLVLGTAATSTTFDLNTGSIDLKSGADATKLRIAGTVTLNGDGKINLSGDGAQIVADGSAATLTNGETISGQGLIGGPLLDFVNAGKGIIDATTGGNVISIEANQFTNSGLVETTGSGDLFFGTDITQTAHGNIKIDGRGAKAELEFVTITGGVVSIGAGALLEGVGSVLGSSVLKDQTQPITNAGEIDATASSLIIEDSIKNTATASLVVGSNSVNEAYLATADFRHRRTGGSRPKRLVD